MNRLAWLGLAGGLLAASASAQCGYPDFTFATGGSSGAGASSSAGTTTSTTSTTSTSTSGSGGEGGGTSCDLVTAAPCGAGLTCIYETPSQQTECAPAGNQPKLACCQADSDCQRGLACIDLGLGFGPQCVAWCTPPSDIGSSNATGCPNGFCYSLSPSVRENGVAYGGCDD